MEPRGMPAPITAEQRLYSEVQTAMLHELFWSHLGARLSSCVTDTILVIFASTNVLWSSLNSLLLVWTALYFMKSVCCYLETAWWRWNLLYTHWWTQINKISVDLLSLLSLCSLPFTV